MQGLLLPEKYFAGGDPSFTEAEQACSADSLESLFTVGMCTSGWFISEKHQSHCHEHQDPPSFMGSLVRD